MNLSNKLDHILPKKAENDYKGYRIAYIVLLVITAVTIFRSLIHFLAPDGGAQSIATIDLNMEGAEIIIAAFALWGSSQLLMVVVYVVVLVRYRNLISLMYILIIIEYVMRIIVGITKPFETAQTPPGAILNIVIIPLAITMLILSILQPKKGK
jgi:hypothetical protein